MLAYAVSTDCGFTNRPAADAAGSTVSDSDSAVLDDARDSDIWGDFSGCERPPKVPKLLSVRVVVREVVASPSAFRFLCRRRTTGTLQPYRMQMRSPSSASAGTSARSFFDPFLPSVKTSIRSQTTDCTRRRNSVAIDGHLPNVRSSLVLMLPLLLRCSKAHLHASGKYAGGYFWPPTKRRV